VILTLFDECVHRDITQRDFAGYADIALVREFGPVGLKDEDIMALARREGRVLVTEDFGFGQLVFHRLLPPPPGVLLIALSGTTHVEREERLAQTAEKAFAAIAGNFVTIGRERIRERPLPAANEN
jgi:predicted nuclease of predicted toxin-antitoxin system